MTSTTTSDDAFLDAVADALIGLPFVEAVALGGSRAQGTHHADSDWDVAVYYRDGFTPQTVRELGWPSAISELGGWGQLFDGGGKLDVDGHPVDVHYRDLARVHAVHEAALRGEFTIEPLLFHQAGLPSYILLAELGVSRTLRGETPRWGYPEALRRTAPPIWRERAELTLLYAEEGHARRGRGAQCAGLVSEAACHAAHAVLARRGEWITNEKQLLSRAGLRGVDGIVARLGADPDALLAATARARELLEDALGAEGI